MKNTALFAGRVEELQVLFQALGRVESGESRVVLLEGAAGLGKTALLSVFAERSAQRLSSGHVFHVRASDASAYHPVAHAAAEATHRVLYDPVGGRRQALRTAREVLPDWLGAIPVVGDLIAALVATVQALRRRRRQEVPEPIRSGDDDAEALLAAAARHPLVLLLDDLERADPAGIEQLECLVRNTTAEHRLLIIGAYRPAAPGLPTTPVQQWIQALPLDSVRILTLRELGVEELEALLTKRFPYVTIPPPFLHRLLEITGGQPQAVDAALDDLVDRSVIRFVDRRWHVSTGVEELTREGGVAVAAALTIDLSGVRPAVVALLRVASVLGEEFDGSTLASLLERDELYVEDQLALAARQGLVGFRGEVTTPSGEIATLFRFGSSAVRAALLREVSPEERAEICRRHTALAAAD